jgi:predicted transcriptional regulator YdeE/DNA-binding transcriptional MerR regulator
VFKIGDFSKLAQVSIKALRYYGKLGLLKPAWIDRYTGYRYYTLEQLPRLNRILALKDLGFSLEQVRQLLRDDLSAAELRGMMRLKHAELERHIQTEQSRLARIEARLQQIEQEGVMPAYEVVLKSVPTQRVVGIRDVISGYHDVVHLFEELRAWLKTRAVTLDTSCPGIAVYYDVEYHERGVDVEVAAPIPGSLPGTSRAIVHELPGVETMACVIHQGSYKELPQVHNNLMAWIEANRYRVAGPNRAVHLQGLALEPETANCVTEVQFPVREKPIPTFITQYKEKSEMEPKFVRKEAFTVVGMLYHGKNEKDEIPQLWRAFGPRMGEVQHIARPDVVYGVCDEFEESSGTFKYVAGFEVDSAADIPQGMVSWEMPAQEYAVFSCTIPTISETYQYVHETWLPGSGYQRAAGPDFEFYNEDFDPEDKDSGLYLYIPVEQL